MVDMPTTYGVICTANLQRIYVSMDVLDKVGELLDTISDHQGFDMPMFVKFTDLAGSEFRVRVVQIESMWESTPDIRNFDRLIEATRKAEGGYGD
jgi:hypothetical protein